LCLVDLQQRLFVLPEAVYLGGRVELSVDDLVQNVEERDGSSTY